MNRWHVYRIVARDDSALIDIDGVAAYRALCRIAQDVKTTAGV